MIDSEKVIKARLENEIQDTEWVTADGDFHEKERKILQELLSADEFAALEKAEHEQCD